jgi:hypothetical protein
MSGQVYPVEQTFALARMPGTFVYKSAVRIRASAALALSALALAGCSRDGDDDQPAAWGGPPEPAADGTVAVDGFVEYMDGVEEHWESSPAMSAGEFLRLDQQDAARTSIASATPAEGAGPATVIVTLDGLFDDSVRAERWTLTFTPDGDVYELTAAEWAQRCQPGRGHQAFTPEPCV